MSESNLAAFLYKERDMRVKEQPVCKPGPGQVQISMSHVGICGSDVHFWQNMGVGNMGVKEPIILGHEGAGVISNVGEGVTHLKIGDRVVIEPLVPCKYCDFCKSGRYNLCPTRIFCSVLRAHGLLKRFHVHDADFCYKLPSHVSTEEAALIEPLAIAVHACSLAGVKIGTKMLICGAGPIGFTTLLVAKAFGASDVCITGKRHLELAKKLGADYTVNVTGKEDIKELASKVEETMGDQPDITVDCVGTTECVKLAVHATRPGGCIALVGLRSNEAVFPLVDTVLKEIKMIGISVYANRFPTTLEMLASGKVDVKPLITHRFKLEDTAKAFETAHSGQGIKVMIECGKD